MSSNCEVCIRIEDIQTGKNPFFVKELETGYVVLADDQFYWGYALFLCKLHAHEIHELEPAFAAAFLKEMSQVAHAVHLAFNPDKLNYELLGNLNPHLHWHIIPRRSSDPKPETGIWAVPKEERSYQPTAQEIRELKAQLLLSLESIRQDHT